MKMLRLSGLIALASLACSNGTAAKDDTPVRAAEVTYDPAASGLASQNAQTAIDELAEGAGASEARLAALEASKATAATVTYDGTAAGLSAGTVQAAVDEVAAEQASQGAKQEAMESAGKGLASGLAAVQTDVAALKSTSVDASSVAVAAIPELTATNVQEALAALQSQIAAQKSEINALKATIATLEACPDDMFDIGDSCIEKVPRQAVHWTGSAIDCYGDKRRLCSFDEYEHACNEGVYTDQNPEWTADWVDGDAVLLATFGLNECHFKTGIAAKTSAAAPPNPFRCCTNK